ncbi:MAG: hypothetical protein IT371_16640 [Deltaproteobacteria bacterium]|nr:hypothetical protein [Deltaproteobacteria bacterium]
MACELARRSLPFARALLGPRSRRALGLAVALGFGGSLLPLVAVAAKKGRNQEEASPSVTLRGHAPATFLRLFPLNVIGGQGGLNPVPKKTAVFARGFGTKGTDVLNVMVFVPEGAGRYSVVFREQARVPVALRRGDPQRPGGTSFVLSESMSESLEVAKGLRIGANLVRGVAEELGLRQMAKTTLSDTQLRRVFRKLFGDPILRLSDLAISPDRSAGVTTVLGLVAKHPLDVDQNLLREARSGELAETGVRSFPRVPLERAIRYLQMGRLIDGRVALGLLASVSKAGLTVPASLASWPSATERADLARDFDPERRRGTKATDYTRVELGPSTDPVTGEADTGDGLRIASRSFTVRTKNGRESRTDKFEHKAAVAPDQVSELPVLRGPDGQLYVGLVPTVSPGMLARTLQWVAEGLANPVGNVTSGIQLRGIVRDVAGYAKVRGGAARADKGQRGNLGVRPIYEEAIRGAHRTLAGLGLEATQRTFQLGNFNASVGENAFHMNLVVREFALRPGVSLDQVVKQRRTIRFVPLHEAVAFGLKNPTKVDQMTQVQLLLLALKEKDGRVFRFRAE